MLIDAHSHLDKYADCLNDALDEINRHNILTLSNSMDVPSYKHNLEIGRQSEYVLPAFGIHPWNAHLYADRLEELEEFIRESAIIGEIGLDYFFVKEKKYYEAQQKILEFFLTAAKRDDKIVCLHTKGAEKEILETLAKHDQQRVIVHWYSGPISIFEKMIDRGMYFTVGVELLYSESIKLIASKIPVHLLLLETDNPGAFQWLKGTQGMPSQIIDVAKKLAEIRKAEYADLLHTVNLNFLNLIGTDKSLTNVKKLIESKLY